MSSRRLPAAYERATNLVNQLRARAGQITPDSCEGDGDLRIQMEGAIQYAAEQVRLKTNYFDVFPWILARTGKAADAATVLERLPRKQPTDPYSCWFLEQFKASIEAVAAGGEPSDAHASELRRLATIPLDESPGEGIHRETALRKHRAAAASLPWLKSGLRLGQNLARVNALVAAHGDRARKLICFEWYMAKRLLRVTTRRRWKPIKIEDRRPCCWSHIVS